MQKRRVLVVTSDFALASTIESAVHGIAEFSAVGPLKGEEVLRRARGTGDCVVIDARLRKEELPELFSQLININRSSGTKCVLIVTPEHLLRAASVAAGADEAVLLLFAHESVANLVFTHVMDPSGTLAAARAHRCLVDTLPEAFHEMVALSFAIGPASLTVDKLAAHYAEHRTTLGRLARRQQLPRPREIKDLVRSAYAIELILQTGRPLVQIAKAVGFEEVKDLRKLMLRCFRLTPSEILAHRGTHSLKTLIENWVVVNLVESRH
jgi:AraC-like DNA-binding protein